MRRWRWWTSRAELRRELEVWRMRAGKADANAREAHARTKRVRLEYSERIQELSNRADQAEARLRKAEIKLRLIEPERRDGCGKVRLHFREEARQWAAQVAGDTGGTPDEFQLYRCRICPRSPVTAERYWHIGHSDAGGKADAMKRRDVHQQKARVSGSTVAQRIDPRVLAQLRQGGRTGR